MTNIDIIVLNAVLAYFSHSQIIALHDLVLALL